MPTRQRTIIALGGGGWMMEPDNPLLDDYVLAAAGTTQPRIALLATATGDRAEIIAQFYDSFAGRARATHLPLFRRDRPVDILLEQDIVYVTGGDTLSMLATWRAHGVDDVLRRCYEAGVVLAGLSAGSLCWFECGVTDSVGDGQMAPLRDGLGLLPGSHCPHYDGEELRRPAFTSLVSSGVLPPGFAVDDGAALRFEFETLEEAVSSRRGASAWHVGADGHHEPIRMRFLGEES